MMGIPRAALLLGLSGVLPFAFCNVAPLLGIPDPTITGWHLPMALYGLTILSFMSGCIWAFAARVEDALGYALSTLPALFGAFVLFFTVTAGARGALWLLAVGFGALLFLDVRALNLDQTPPWWLRLRSLLTFLVIISLCLGAYA